MSDNSTLVVWRHMYPNTTSRGSQDLCAILLGETVLRRAGGLISLSLTPYKIAIYGHKGRLPRFLKNGR